jgi:general secretion pathway protein A
MYFQHFRLSGEPFSLTPDPAFLFLSVKHREAMAAVQYGLLNGRGFITLIGEVGTGKTTILYSVLSQLGPEVAAAYVPYAAHTFDDLLAAALKDLGEQPPAGASRLALLEILQRLLLQRDAAGVRTALVIDEAQSLTDATFEELRLLSNFETYTHKLLQIVLVGQPELQQRLRQQNLRQLQQRVSVRAIINPLDADEMEAYILHRLKQVGGDERLFEPAALRLIVRHSQGIPRRANILCHNGLLFAFGRSEPRVTAAVAQEAIAEMDERRPGLLHRDALRRLPRLRLARSWRRLVGLAVAAAALLVLGTQLLGSSTSADRTVGAAQVAAAVPPAPPPPAAAPPAADPAPTPAPAPEPSDAPAAPVVPAAAAATDAPAPVRVATVPSNEVHRDSGDAEHPTVSIPPGGSILGVARQMFGELGDRRATQAFLGEVRRLNPDLHDVNVVMAGAVVRFPSTPSGDPRTAGK